jgi:hypothetical protein
MTLIHSKSSEFDMDKYYLSVYEKQLLGVCEH